MDVFEADQTDEAVGRKGSSRKEKEDMVAELVERELTVSVEGKVVIYCKTRAEVSRLVRAGRFVCEEFRADMSEQRKDKVLEDFRVGRKRVVVATSALDGDRHSGNQVDCASGRAAKYDGLRAGEQQSGERRW